MRAFRLAYDGRPYHGFQRQPDVPTVEGALLDALRELGVLDADVDVPPGYAAAGRTDAGVSAVAQTVAFEAPGWCHPRALNGALPDDVRALASADVPDGFHARHDATRRAYVSHQPAPDADGRLAREAAASLSGEHDFHNLTPDDRGSVRTLDVSVATNDGFLVLTVASDGFPRQLVRRLASLVRAVASGEAPMTRIDRVLAAEPLDGRDGVSPAPTRGLVLTAVDYPTVSFVADDVALESTRSMVHDRLWERRTDARTYGAMLDLLPGMEAD